MDNGAILEHNLTRSRLTQDDLMAKLREANAFDLRHVYAVVFEATRDVSVLHVDPRDNEKISSEVCKTCAANFAKPDWGTTASTGNTSDYNRRHAKRGPEGPLFVSL